MSRKPRPSRDRMRRLQDQFLELPQVMQFAREHGEAMPVSDGRPSIRQIRALLYPQWFWWFQECVDNQEMQL